MYFIAIVASEEINQQALRWKNYFKESYGCTVALKSPAHITIIPPFWMKEELQNELITSMIKFSHLINKFEIALKDFNAFKPRTIFINVTKNDPLNTLYGSFADFLNDQNKFPIKKEDRPFHPHVTLATRDLHKKAFYEAWDIFSQKKFEASWTAKGISLLKHNKKNWDVIFTSQFKD
jgi:2'-5' RNA ligase